MIHNIRPYQVFSVAQCGEPKPHILHVKMPGRYENVLLDTFVLLAVNRIVKPTSIFEFGTFRGATALNLVHNSDWSTLIYTLDLQELPDVQTEKDLRWATESLSSERYFGPENTNIVALRGDSTKTDLSQFYDRVNLVIVDGGHALEVVASDTRKAFSMVNSAAPGAIAWHDYTEPAHPHIEEFLRDVSADRDFVHVEETKWCFWFNRPEVLEQFREAATEKRL